MRRRDFLAALGATACKPELPTGVAGGIDHVVFVMMENRSFDHYFGALTLEEGRLDVNGLTAGMTNPSHLGSHGVFPLEAGWCPLDPPHGWNSCRRQYNEGANDGFAREFEARHGDGADPGLVMGYARRSTLPVLYALADQYTLCDRWFCDVMGPTWPNRLYAHGAQSLGVGGNDLPSNGFFSMPTIWSQLDSIDVSWNYFYSDLPFIAIIEGTGDWVQQDKVTGIDRFFEAAEAGTLPAVSFVDPAFDFNDDHPPHHPLLGQLFLATVHNALAASPQWERTLLVITYDEHGGFYDHEPPPTVADAHPDFQRLGFRVPAVVCGPWARPGYVDSTQYSHASWLTHVQGLHGLGPLTERDAAAHDLSNALDFDRPARPPAELPVIAMTADEIEHSCDTQRSSNQPELRAHVATQMPHLDLSEDDIVRRQLAWAEHFGALTLHP